MNDMMKRNRSELLRTAKNKKKRSMGFFGKYELKQDGAIRGFDVKSTGVKVLCIGIMIFCLLMAVICLFPVIWLVLASFKDLREFTRSATILPASFDWTSIKETWDMLGFQKYYLNSLISVSGSVACSILFNGMMGYAFAVLKPKGYKIALGLVMWSLLIPSTTGIIAVMRNISLIGLKGSFIPIWLTYGANAFYVVLFKNFFEEIPRELVEAAKIDGAGALRVFFRIIMPLSKPIVMVVLIFSMVAAWSDFLLPYLVLNGSGKETVMVKLFSFKDTPTTTINVIRATLFAIVPPAILFCIFQRKITDGAAAGAVKG